MNGASAVILWDVDLTLVDAAGFGGVTYRRAFELTFGRPLHALPAMAGRSDLAIIADTLALNDAPADHLDAFVRNLHRATDEDLPRLRRQGRALPGAAEALAALRDAGHRQTVVTGNLRRLAAAKLDAFGLTGPLDLDLGGYGEDGADRADLVRAALARCGAAPDDAVVIGDTPHDVRGAADAGVRCVGVATGATGEAELRAAGAAETLPSLQSTETLLAAVKRAR